jgi:hypothetical protein
MASSIIVFECIQQNPKEKANFVKVPAGARKSKLAAVARQEFSHGAEGFGADVVFDALGIDAGGFLAHTEGE